jgi:hypothetical protein
MDKVHENKNSMYKAVDEFFIENQPKSAVIPALTTKVAAFHNIVLAIENKNGEVMSATKGKTQEKADAQEAMLDLLFRIKSNLRSVAKAKNDQDTIAVISMSESSIAGMRDTDQKAYAETIYQIAMTNAAALVDFGVDAAMLTDLKTRIDTFGTKLGAREGAPSQHSALRTSLFELFRQADAALDDLDDTMASYKTTDPEFYNQYTLVESVKAMGIRHKPQPAPANTPQPGATK